jgi:disease resistance protein RPS2
MESQASIRLDILSEEDAWNFFVKKARKSFHESTDFYDVGRKVASECAGLPLALVAVARALATQDIEEWKAAARRLEMSQTPNPEEDEDHRAVYESIKLSYDYLRGDDAKPFFLLCCLFPEDDDIPIADLMKYGLGIGLFRDVINTIASARVRENSVAKHLKDSSLLLESKKEGCVRMHDVIRDTAISIASSKGILGKAGCKLEVWPSIIPEGCSEISLMRNRIQELPEELVCSKLQILLLKDNYLEKIPETFFQRQQNALRVLDVSHNYIYSVPSSLSFLVNLQALYLDSCIYIADIYIHTRKTEEA